MLPFTGGLTPSLPKKERSSIFLALSFICYNFQPSDNPDSITKEQLVANLEECFAASPLFAKFCLPLLLEKLESNVSGSKADSLSALVMLTLIIVFCELLRILQT